MKGPEKPISMRVSEAKPSSTQYSRPKPELDLLGHLSARKILLSFGILEAVLLIAIFSFQMSHLDRVLADRCRAAKDFAGAQKYLDKLYKKNPNDFILNFQIGEGLGETGKYLEAVEFLQKAERNASSDPRSKDYMVYLHSLLGKAYYNAGQVDNATNAIREALSLNPELPLANVTMARIYLTRKDLVRAGSHTKNLISNRDFAEDLDSLNSQAGKLIAVSDAELNDVPERVAVSPEVSPVVPR